MPGHLLAVGMALQDAVQLPEVLELIAAEKALFRQHAVVAGGRMALAQHEAVAVLRLGILGIDTHMVVKHADHQLHRREGAAGVAGTGICRHVDNIPTYLTAYAGELCCIHGGPPFLNVPYKITAFYRKCQ